MINFAGAKPDRGRHDGKAGRFGTDEGDEFPTKAAIAGACAERPGLPLPLDFEAVRNTRAIALAIDDVVGARRNALQAEHRGT